MIAAGSSCGVKSFLCRNYLDCFLVFILLLAETSSAFVAHPSSWTRSSRDAYALDISTCSAKATHLFMGKDESLVASASPSVVTLQDKNGKTIQVGVVVRVAVEGLKAYQVPIKGQGSFSAAKEFVPAAENSPRGTKNLLLPVGIRGVVSKVYDYDDISANFPVQVKFLPGKNTEEGYDPPVAFIMHFLTDEIECV